MQVLAAAERLRHAAHKRALHALLQQPLDALSPEERPTLAQRLKSTARGEHPPR